MGFVVYFHGKIVPERVMFSLGRIVQFKVKMGSKVPDSDLIADLTISIEMSQIAVKVETEKSYDIIALKDVAKASVSFIADIYGAFMHGYAYNTEITSASLLDGKQIVFGVDFQAVSGYIKEHFKGSFEEILSTEKGDNDSTFFVRALHDLKEAIDNPNDTGFFAYRAIEDIRQSFSEEDGDDSSDSWESLRDHLKIDKSYIASITPYRNGQAHGGLIYMTSEKRAEVIIIAWEVIHRFHQFLLKNKNALSEKEFEILK